MEKKNVKKITIISVAIVLALAIICGIVASIKKSSNRASISSEILRSMDYEQLTPSEEIVDNTGDKLKFSAFFTKDLDGDGYAEKLLGACNEIGVKDTLYIDINVEAGGTLQNGVITINSSNFTYKTQLLKDTVLKNNYVSNNLKRMELNTLQAGSQKLINGDVSASVTSESDYTKTNTVTLTGLWVPDATEENQTPKAIEISKTVDLTIDWYGTAKASLSAPYTSVDLNEFKELEDKSIEFDLTLNETQKKLITTQNHIELDIPQLFDNYPTSVVCKNTGVQANYNENTHKLVIEKNTSAYSNKYTIQLTYPEESIDKIYNGYAMQIPVSGYITCSNNSNEQFENPYITDTVNATKVVNFFTYSSGMVDYLFSTQLADKEHINVPHKGYAISKKKILEAYSDAVPENMKYTVMWKIGKNILSESTEQVGIIMNEIKKSDGYGDIWSGTLMSEYITNKGIYFAESNFLSEDSQVIIYNNDNDQIIKRLTYAEVRQYNSPSNILEYDVPIKHIRIETSEVNPEQGAYFIAYNIKEVNTSEVVKNIDKTQVENMDTVRTDIAGALTNGLKVTGFDDCYLISDKSYASISLSQPTISIEQKADPIDEIIKISVPSKNVSYAGWRNGEFLVKIPSEIAYMALKEVKSNRENVKISGYDLERKNGQYFIKIITKNDEITSNFDISISCKMLANPTTNGRSSVVELYSYNENCKDYYYGTNDVYDVNSNGNVREEVGISTVNLGIQTAKSFITLETISNYNGEEITVAPNIAEIPNDNQSGSTNKTATINVEVLNNYDNSVENIAILGKTPFEENKYIKGDNLGSKYTAKMISGITVPSSLTNKAKVYYSTNAEPEASLEEVTSEKIINMVKAENSGWIPAENITDQSMLAQIKSYVIIIENTTINSGSSYRFSYNVEVPNNATLNDTAYSCHSVSYELNTDGGKLRTTVQPNKIGLRPVRYYDFDVTKYKKDKDLVVPNAKYELIELNEIPLGVNTSEVETTELNGTTYELNNRRILVSSTEGKIKNGNLRVNQIYSFKEIQAPKEYELNTQNIVFKVTENTNGELEYVLISNNDENFEENVEFKTDEDGKQVLTAKVKDTPKVILNILKTDSESNDPIDGVVFEVNNENYITVNGKIKVESLSLNTEYTLSEKIVNNYYKINDIKFKFVEDNGTISIQSGNSNELPEGFNNAEIINDDINHCIQVNINITNEKIPTYNLKIIKVDESDETKKLANAKFLLKRADTLDAEYITTNDEGVGEANNLYEFVSGKTITGRYTIQEVEAPSGYVLNTEEIQFLASHNNNELKAYILQDQSLLHTLKSIEVEGNTVIITLQDRPLFKLKKVDEADNKPLANADFRIYKLNDDGSIGDYAKDSNGNFIGKLDDNGEYIVTTDNNGEITLGLSDGTYKIIETGYPEGYEDTPYSEVFTIMENEKKPNFTISTPTYEPVQMSYPFPTTDTLEINSIEDLLRLSQNVKNGNDYSGTLVKLNKSLDFEDTESYENAEDTSFGDVNEDGDVKSLIEELTDKEGKGFLPIGGNTTNDVFCGQFDGQGHEISNLYINGDSNNSDCGLFGKINNSKIANVTVNGTIKAIDYVGGIAGVVSGYSHIQNCKNYCNIEARSSSAGIVGTYQGSSPFIVEDCENYGDVKTSSMRPAGIVGELSGSQKPSIVILKNCSNHGIITNDGSGSTAGIITEINSGVGRADVINCNNYGDVIAQNSHDVGGIVGRLDVATSYFVNCKNEGRIDGSKGYAAGIIACSTPSVSSGSGMTYISGCKNSGSISGYYETSGIIGYSYFTEGSGTLYIGDCINSGQITQIRTGYYGASGILGRACKSGNTVNVIMLNCENNGGINGVGNWAAGIAADLEASRATIISCSNKAGISEMIQTSNVNDSHYMGGIIGICQNGNLYVADCHNSAYVVVQNNSSKLDLSAGGIAGAVRGSGNSIVYSSNLGHVQGAYVGGIMGDGSANITHCDNRGQTILTVKGNTSQIGGIAGRNSGGEITYCINEDDIVNTASSNENMTWIGGIVGISYGSIKNCTNKGNITSAAPSESLRMGGIAGSCDSTYNNCINKGTVVNSAPVLSWIQMGGIVGYAGSSVCKNCANLNKVYNSGTVTNGNINIGGIAGIGGSNFTYCYNTGIIVSYGLANETQIGGITGSNVTTEYCYNTGDIINGPGKKLYIGGISCYGKVDNCYNSGNISSAYAGETVLNIGGITAGRSDSTATQYVKNCYNTGNISISNVANIGNVEVNLGGLSGYSGLIENSYNFGNVSNRVYSSNPTYNSKILTSALSPSCSTKTGNYYASSVDIYGNNIIPETTEINEENLTIEEMMETLGGTTNKWIDVGEKYPQLDIGVVTGIDGVVELTVTNKKAKFDVTTEIGENSSGNRTGGTITGTTTSDYPGNKKFVETIEYGKSSTKDIIITPQENYQIQNIMINGKQITFEEKDDGSYTIPAGYFENTMSKNHVIVNFANSNNSIIINKVDEKGNGVSGAKFKIEKVNSSESENDPIIVETDERGQAVQELSVGISYSVSEIEAPKGYSPDNESQTVNITGQGIQELTFVNQKQKEAIVHYYVKGTESLDSPVKLKDDVHIYGKAGDRYSTQEYIETELKGYTLEVDENNEYVIPSNAEGEFTENQENPIEVNYYYEKNENKRKNISAQKIWNMPENEVNEYRATIKLVKIENGKEVDVYDENGNEVKAVIKGNQNEGKSSFKGLKQYEDGHKIEYKVKEILIEKLDSINNETQEEIWVPVPINNFDVTYNFLGHTT